MIPNTIGA